MEEQNNAEQTPVEETPAEVTEQEAPVEEPVVEEAPVEEADVDEKGVPYKNRYAEAERKRQQKEEELEELKFRLQQVESLIPKAVPQQPKPQEAKPDLSDPDKYIEYRVLETQKALMKQKELADAENLIKEKFGPARLGYGVSKVLDYAEKNFINLNANPVKAVAKILADMEKPKMKEISKEEKQRTKEAIKNKPEKGRQTPPPPAAKDNSAHENLSSRGTRDDAVAWLMDRFKE